MCQTVSQHSHVHEIVLACDTIDLACSPRRGKLCQHAVSLDMYQLQELCRRGKILK